MSEGSSRFRVRRGGRLSSPKSVDDLVRLARAGKIASTDDVVEVVDGFDVEIGPAASQPWHPAFRPGTPAGHTTSQPAQAQGTIRPPATARRKQAYVAAAAALIGIIAIAAVAVPAFLRQRMHYQAEEYSARLIAAERAIAESAETGEPGSLLARIDSLASEVATPEFPLEAQAADLGSRLLADRARVLGSAPYIRQLLGSATQAAEASIALASEFRIEEATAKLERVRVPPAPNPMPRGLSLADFEAPLARVEVARAAIRLAETTARAANERRAREEARRAAEAARQAEQARRASIRGSIEGTMWLTRGDGRSDIQRGIDVVLMRDELPSTSADGIRRCLLLQIDSALELADRVDQMADFAKLKRKGRSDAATADLSSANTVYHMVASASLYGRDLLSDRHSHMVGITTRFECNRRMFASLKFTPLLGYGTFDQAHKVTLDDASWPQIVKKQLVSATSTDANGRFAFDGIPAGSYLVFARVMTSAALVDWVVPVEIDRTGMVKLDLSNRNAATIFEGI
jgi:hypothetical protein